MPRTLWYAKVDSVFRGYPGPQIAFLLRQTGRRAVIVAPALPDQGRMTVDGDVYVNDVLLTETPLGVRPLDRVGGRAARLTRRSRADRSGWRRCARGAEKVRAAIAHMVRPIVVVDAETNGDLSILAEAVIDDGAHLLAGSAGFSKQVAQQARHARWQVAGCWTRSASERGAHRCREPACLLCPAGHRAGADRSRNTAAELRARAPRSVGHRANHRTHDQRLRRGTLAYAHHRGYTELLVPRRRDRAGVGRDGHRPTNRATATTP